MKIYQIHCQIFFIKRFTLTMDSILIVLLRLIQAKFEIQK